MSGDRERGLRPSARRGLPHAVQQAAEGIGIVTAAALALLAAGWLAALLVTLLF